MLVLHSYIALTCQTATSEGGIECEDVYEDTVIDLVNYPSVPKTCSEASSDIAELLLFLLLVRS